MNSSKRRDQAAHRAATELAARCRCLACNAPAPSEPAHWPRHRGSGGRWASEWHPDLWVPACRKCHRLLDGHHAISEGAKRATQAVWDRVTAKAPAWRKWAREQWGHS